MPPKSLVTAAALAFFVAGCATTRRGETPPSPALAHYKVQVAQRIAANSRETFVDPLPEVLKSVVVLDISIDRGGAPRQISVRRSNGIRSLEQRAEDSVRRAAPFARPPSELTRGTGEVRFLETFLFRDDGRFQIRTLVDTPQ